MTLAYLRRIARGALIAIALPAVLFLHPTASRAELEADPKVLYQVMLDAYAKAQQSGWDYTDQLYYFATIVNAGRAYSLQHPDDPNYGKLAALTIQMGTALHYNPLTNHDAAGWYVREASLWVIQHANDPTQVQQAQALLERVNAEDSDYSRLAQLAQQDALALAHDFAHDAQADVLPLEAAWRGWLLTHDVSWRSKALDIAAQPNFPITSLEMTYAPAFIQAAQNAVANVAGFTAADRSNAQIALDRLKSAGKLDVIAHVTAVPEDIYLTRLAPADEYFGPMEMSILGIENAMKHVNFMLDYDYGNRESDDALQIAESVEDMQKVYPQDRDMARLLFDTIKMLDRMTTSQIHQEAQHLRSLLLVEYQDSPQAQQLLGNR